MDVGTLVRHARSLGGESRGATHLQAAMIRGETTTLRRAQYFLVHLGHDPGDIKWFEEFASGEA